ncbi:MULTISPECIES: efflux RND transporter permease subunit [Arcobacteraceae]|uniref:Acriflavin resistance protein n=1 Tax=Arcobacter ellisii TaxID=913109 RepID=A0A347UA63_9BACT|nr:MULTISPECIES: efflux RND transporter permease subunit [Arcobacteraceae]AXX95741.1 RND family efflux system, inner membrane transporter, AcrB family [Arcobacter ellisii]QEZ88713.1 RND family efflux system, inner membrane transporter, AcrB family [Aliarcobacter cibarius]RXI31387.1 acriflavin resistance protein [Arcobacter ellisii]
MYKLAINRPITTLMGVLTFIVFGLMSYNSMPTNLFPNVDFPVVTVQTTYNGADPSTVETKVTDKIEEAVSGVDGIDKLMSTSYEGFSVVTIQFELTKDLDEATNDVRDKIGALNLPAEVEKPVVKKLGGAGAVISLFIASEGNDTSALMRLADEKLKPQLQRIKGVGEVNILGYQDREIRIFIDPFLLNKYNLTPADVSGIIQKQNIKQGVGKLVNQNQEIIIKAQGDAQNIEEVGNLLVKPGVRLKDIATVQDGLSDAKSFSSFNGQQGVTLEVKKIAGENVLNIINEVKKTLPKLQILAGDKTEIKILQDQSEKIMVNINNVRFDLIFGAFLAVIIVFLFLRNVTATFVSALAIPTSVIGTFAIINYLGYDLNRLTLIGLTLAIGIFIDDAIVVIENIMKKMENGMEPFRASFEGAKEVAFSVLAISSVLLAVFVPVAFMDGIVGMFFNSFAMTVAAGIVISFLVAIMFIPSIAARVLSSKESAFYHKTEPILKAIDKGYVWLLKPLIKYKTLTIIVTVGLLVASTTLKVGMSFLPMQDNAEFQITIKAPVGINLESMKKVITPLDDMLKEDKDILYSISSIGYNSANELHKGRIYVKLKTLGERVKTQEAIIQHYRDKLSSIQGMIISVEKVDDFDTGATTAPVQVVITGDKLEELDKASAKLMAILKETSGIVDVDRDFENGKPEIKIGILRENAQRVGVSVEQIASILGSAYSSESAVSYYEDNGRQFDITVRLKDDFRSSLDDLKKLQVRNSNGQFVALEGLIEIKESLGNASINRFDRERKVLVTANIFNTSLDKIVAVINEKMPEILPKGYNYRFTGDVEDMEDTNKAFGAAVLLAVILIYLILAALYESIIQPFIIMISMPLSFTGVMVALYLSGNSFSLFVMIGIILLLGMVGKNAILVVDFANRAIKDGKSIDDALLEAGEKRLRPILMTTFAMIGAMIPLAFGSGAGHESNAPMALAIIGGLMSSTILTLLVVPAIYKFMYPLDAWLRKWYEKGKIQH